MQVKTNENKPYDVGTFDKEDIALRVAYNKVRKFQVRSPADLKAGTYINCRETVAIRNMVAETIKLNGRAAMDRNKTRL